MTTHNLKPVFPTSPHRRLLHGLVTLGVVFATLSTAFVPRQTALATALATGPETGPATGPATTTHTPALSANPAAAAVTCNAFALQKTWRMELNATYSRKDAHGFREAEVNQMANFAVTFEEEYTDDSKVRWLPQVAQGLGRIQGRDVYHDPNNGDRVDEDFGSGSPVAVHGSIELNRNTCTYTMYANVVINSTTKYADGNLSHYVDSPVEFKVKDRPVPTDTARMAAPSISATEPFTVYVVTWGAPEEFVPAGAASAVRALASAQGSDTAGHANVTWRILPGQPLCAGRTGPIDINDPVLEDEAGLVRLELAYDEPYIRPNEKARVRAYATCAGVPINGARVIVLGEAFRQSGFHVHGGAQRPDGYLNGQKIVDGQHFIELKTDARGIAEFDFEPGRDTLNEKIGIAGEYHLSANLPEFPITADDLNIIVKVPELVALPQHSNSHINWDQSPAHNWNGHWGTPATLSAIQELGEMMLDGQRENNGFRVAKGLLPWPIVPLFVNDISLQWGGLFDVVGWDAAAGRVRGTAWQPPHYTHTDGKEVDFSMSAITGPLAADWRQVRNTPLTPAEMQEATAMLRAGVRAFGRHYGTWISNQTYTLRANQSGLIQSAAGVNQIAASADPEVALFPTEVEREQNPVIGPGQSISLTLVAHNLLGNMQAEGVTLSAALPAGLNFVSANPAPSRMQNGQPVWDIGTLLTGTRMSFVTLTATVGANVAAGTPLTISAQVAGNGADADLANNASTTTLVVQPLGPDQSIATTLETVPLMIGEPTTFSVTVSNLGTLAANQSELSVVLPPSVTLKSAWPLTTSVNEGRDFRWHFGTLARNESRVVTLTVEVPQGAVDVSDGQNPIALPFRFVIGSDMPDVFIDNNDVVMTRTPTLAGTDLSVGLLTQGLVGAGGARPGDVITVMVPYANHSQQVAPSAMISVMVDAGLTVLDAQPLTVQTDASSNGVVPVVTPAGVYWDLGELPAGANGLLVLRCKVNPLTAASSTILVLAQSAIYDFNIDDNLRERTIWPASASAGLTPVLYLAMLQR